MDSIGEFRISLTVRDFEKAISFYSGAIGLPVEQNWSSAAGKCILLSLGKATLEIVDEAQASMIDSVEVGRRVSGQIRFALQVPDLQRALSGAEAAGARLVHGPVRTPWEDLNARLVGPDGLQLTFFQSPLEQLPT